MEFESVIFKYYGFDWAAMIFTFLSIESFKNKHVKGFIFGGLACICWLSFNVLALSIAGIIANAYFSYMHYKGYKEWKLEK